MKTVFSSIALAMVVACFGMPSKASAEPMFQTLQRLYDSKSSEPMTDDVLGWRTGRCYKSIAPSVPTNGLLAGWTVQGPDHGPMKPGDEALFTFPIYWRDQPADAFDNMTPYWRQQLTNYIEQQKPHVAESINMDNAISGGYRTDPSIGWYLRKNQSYIIAKMFRNGWLEQMCYYFQEAR